MIKYLLKLGRWIADTYEEADSIDPWRGESLDTPNGIRLFDLAALHLEDHGYYPRLYRNGDLIVVYNRRWKRLLDKRVGSIAFEISRPLGLMPINNEKSVFRDDVICYFEFGQPRAMYAGSSSKRPGVVCDVNDPFAIDRILEVTNKHYQI